VQSQFKTETFCLGLGNRQHKKNIILQFKRQNMTIQAQDVKGLKQKIIVYCFYYGRKNSTTISHANTTLTMLAASTFPNRLHQSLIFNSI